MISIAIRVENLSKLYLLTESGAGHIGRARQRHDTLRDAVVGTFKRFNVSTFQRLRMIPFGRSRTSPSKSSAARC